MKLMLLLIWVSVSKVLKKGLSACRSKYSRLFFLNLVCMHFCTLNLVDEFCSLGKSNNEDSWPPDIRVVFCKVRKRCISQENWVVYEQ